MATVNKDFKIKSGLIVEGTSATVGGNRVLVENTTATDDYIVNLIGGETLITSVDSADFTVTAGELTIAAGSDIARTGDIPTNTDEITEIANASNKYFTDSRAVDAVANVLGTGIVFSDEGTGNVFHLDENHLNTQITNGARDAISVPFGGTPLTYDSETGVVGITLAADSSINLDGSNGLKVNRDTVDEWYDASGAASTAQQNAEDYADSLISDGSTTTTNVWSAYKTSTEIGLAQSAAESYADTAIANLVDSAPATLDTLNELAAALQDNPDIISDLQDIAAGKQDTLTAGSNIDITGATISVTGLDTEDVLEAPAGPLYFTNQRALDATSSAYDAAGAASTAESNANSYTDSKVLDYTKTSDLETTVDGYGFAYTSEIPESTDSLTEGVNNLYYTDARAKAEAKALLLNADKTNIQIVENLAGGINIVAENGVADSTTDDLAEGETNLYFTDSRALSAVSGADITPNTVTIDTYRKEEATQQYVASASTVDVHRLSGMYLAAKYVVHVVGQVSGVRHSQITEILMTKDGNNNIAITEYGNVHTSENPLASFSAAYSGPGASANATLTATTAVAGCEIIAAATMLSWAD